MMDEKQRHIECARAVITSLRFPRAQQNDRSALSLLALLNLRPGRSWAEAEAPPMGVTQIMDWVNKYYGRKYAPNTRETFRRQTLHQFCDFGAVLYNPDKPDRPVNSPKAVYQVAPDTLRLLYSVGTAQWDDNLKAYLDKYKSLRDKYNKERDQNRVPVKISSEEKITLSPGEHSKLIKAIIEDFASRFAPGSTLVYVGDTGNKKAYFKSQLLSELGVHVDLHGKMPDVVLYFTEKKWLLLVEAVTNHGPVDGKRHAELTKLFSGSSVGLVYVTAFPNRSIMGRYLSEIAWETEVWVSNAPSHLIHFNGTRFLGPYPEGS